MQQQQNQSSLQEFIAKREYTDEEYRFMMDLEFVQDLSNVFYLKWLADNKYFDDPAFLRYLKYLMYWKQPEYAKYIVYPQCLYFLEKLQDEAFRFLLSDQNHINFLDLESHLALRNHQEFPQKKEDDVNMET